MTMKFIQNLLIALSCIAITSTAMCEPTAKDLTVGAEVNAAVISNQTKIYLTVHLINSSDHEITVLTKNLSLDLEEGAKELKIGLGYGEDATTHDGHPIVPSLYELAPVTLKPNEEAFFSKEMSNVTLTPESKCIVRYSITEPWAKRWNLWSGSAESKAITPTFRKTR